MTSRRRVSYVIPPPSENVPHLQLPPYGIPRNGSTGPLLLRARTEDRPSAQKRVAHPRHRLGVASLALDCTTQLVGRSAPEGILYTGGRDGQVLSWDLGLGMRQRTHKYGVPDAHERRLFGRWEAMTGWGDDVAEEEEEEEDAPLDGDILGDVKASGGRKRRPSRVDDPIPYEEQWEPEPGSSAKPTAFRQCVQMHSDWVNDILLCNYNQTVISASSDGTVKTWNPHSLTSPEPATVGSHVDYVRCLALCRERNWVASGSFDRTIKLWDLTRSGATPGTEPLLTLNPPDASGPKSSVYALAADPFGHTIASGSPERVVRIWDPRTGKRVAKLVGHTDNIRSILMSEDSRYLLTGSSDASVKLWSLTSQRCLHTFTHHTESVWSLFSSHPSLEIFYSGDRSGLVCKVDVEDCTDVGDGECIALCQDRGEQNLAASEGINRIVALDDHLLWTATGSSSVKRWKVPSRRALRATALPEEADSPGAIDVPRYRLPDAAYSPGRRAAFGAEISRSSSRSPPFGAHASIPPSIADSQTAAPDTSTELNGIPLESLVRLTSPNDPFTPFTSSGARAHDPDVATLYSAASVMSVPRQLRTSLSTNFVGNAAPPTTHTEAIYSRAEESAAAARADYAEREVAADAVPLSDTPDEVVAGEQGLVRSVILNDRVHALTVDTAGEVAVWDIIRGACLGRYAREDVAAASHGGSTAGGSGSSGGEKERSPREALETVRERVEGEAVVVSWAALDTKTGVLTVHLNEKCFEAEIYADEAGYGQERHFNDELRLNIGKWVLRNLFLGFIQEQQRLQRRMGEHFSETGSARGTRRGSAPSHIDVAAAGASSTSLPAREHHSRKQRSPPTSSVVSSPMLVPAVTPSLPSSTRSSPLVPMIQLHSMAKEGGLSPIPQSPPPYGPGGREDATPMPRRQTIDSVVTPGPLPKDKENLDYFSIRTRQHSANGTGHTPPDDSAKPQDGTVPPTPSTPSGLMGRLKSLGRSASKRPQNDGNVPPTPGEVLSPTTPAEGPPPGPSPAQLALQAILANQLTPPSSNDAPPLMMPPTTAIIIAEESPPGWKNIYRGAASNTSTDVLVLEQAMPMWLVEYLLTNKVPQIPVLKLSFVLLPYPAKDPADQLPELLNASQSKLTASRFLRIRKLATHVHEKLERMAHPPNTRTPRSSFETARSSFASSMNNSKVKPEDLYEIMCSETVLPLDMTLAAVRQFIWRQSGELIMHYRRVKPRSPTATGDGQRGNSGVGTRASRTP